MKPRVLSRVLAAAVAALCLCAVCDASAQSLRVEVGARPGSAGPDEAGGRGSRHHRVHVGDGGPIVAITDDAYVAKGQVHDDDIVAIFGNVKVEGEVTGQIVVIMGRLEISGTVRENVVGIMSPMRLEETARIDGDLVSIGGPLDRAPGCQVNGQELKLPFIRGGWAGLWRLLFLLKLISLGLLFLAVLLISALVPRRLSVIAAAFPGKWGMAILVGLIGYCVAVVLAFILVCTFIGIPLALGLMFAAKGIKWLGLASIFFLIGHTIGRNVFKRDLSHFAAVMGGFAVYAVISLVPIFGFFMSAVMGVLALGIALLTRFGSEEGWKRTTTPQAPGAVPPAAPPTAGPPPIYAPGESR
ncbi:MAG TPA: hypothetical protein VKF61_10755 [Candidatus Polarisedimenticolia bacterium]|nr:hypothetical protein [Candidatus Polarisedimenticolia bacterium]